MAGRWNSFTILGAMRPRQWIKNGLLLAGLFFSGRLLDPVAVRHALEGFVIFCLISGCIYLINDVIDAPRDRLHPRKRLRPIASGALPMSAAVTAAILIGTISLLAAWQISLWFLMCCGAYVMMMLAYTLSLKNVFLIDTLIIAMGFMIRAVSGVIVLRTPGTPVELSSWFVICVMFLSLLFAFCKRRAESVNLSEEAGQFRPVLKLYTLPLLDQAIAVCASGAILAYALYSTYTDKQWMFLTTIPFMLFTIFRYLHLVYANRGGEAPELTLTHDLPLLGCIVLWTASLAFVFSPLH